MNYLAHAYCSLGLPPLIVGNLISDFIKGKQQFEYPENIQYGIRLHRLIDTYTDNHPEVAKAKTIYRPAYRLYAGAFVDVSFDYFVANDPSLFTTETELALFAHKAYDALEQYKAYIPSQAVNYFERMKQQNWLYNYRFAWGIQKSFGGIVYRSKYLTESEQAGFLFEENFFLLKECYNNFMPDLLSMVDIEGNKIISQS